MAVILSDEANQKAVLDHLEHLVLLQTDHVLEVGDPDAGVLLRLAQLRVALAKPAETRTRKILDRILIEADATERPDDYKQAAMFSVLKADISPLEPSEWFGLIRQLEAMNTQISPQREQELLGESAYGGSGHLCDFVFTWRAIHIATVRELEEVFQTLDSAEDSVRNRYLATLNDTQLTIRTFVQSAWVRESGLTGFDAIAMADRYVALQDIAMRWKQPELAIECLAGRTTLLSEYASDHSAALATLEAGEALWPGDPRLARERIKILFRLGQHNDVVLESRRYLASDVTDPIERAHALRELAVSSAKLGDAAAAAEFFGKAAQDCAPVSVMADMYAALLADKAQIEFQSGRLETALRTLMEAAAAADALDSETRRGGFVLRMIAGVSAWMVNLLAGGDVEVAGAVVGRCSGAVIETDWPYPVPQKEVIWYQAAAVERQLGLDIGIGDLVDARIRDRRIAVCEITFAFERLADAARSSSEDRLIDAIRNTAQVVAFMDGGGFPSMDAALHQVGPVMPWADLPLRLSPAVVSPVEDAITCFVIGNNLRTLDFSVDALVDRLLATEGLETLASCVRAWGQTLTPDLETLPATLAAGALLLGSPTGDASALMLASFRTWEWLERSVPARRLEAALVTRISDRWIHLCDKAQFGLRLPGITGPAIRTAARETRDRTSLARLMLVADEAVTARMAPSVRKALQDAVG